jgi:multidrug transporter EmrE-like cation transporter
MGSHDGTGVPAGVAAALWLGVGIAILILAALCTFRFLLSA